MGCKSLQGPVCTKASIQEAAPCKRLVVNVLLAHVLGIPIVSHSIAQTKHRAQYVVLLYLATGKKVSPLLKGSLTGQETKYIPEM